MATTAAKQASSRITALDLMRGYLILMIASVHLSYYPSFIGSWGGQGRLWISEAEGFFFISGLLIGIIRRKDIARSGLRVAIIKVLKRGWKLYLAGLILTLVYVAFGRALLGIAPGAVKGGLDSGSSWWNVIFQAVILRYSYGWSDFLIYYAGFLFVTPLFLWLLKRGWWYVALVLTLSLWTWRWLGGYGPYNSFLQWQVYFFVGAIIGYYWNGIGNWFRSLSVGWRRFIRLGTIVVTLIAFFLSVILVFGPATSSSPWLHWIQVVNASNLYQRMLVDGRIGLLRPVIAVVTLAAAYFGVRRFEAQILRFTGWLLLPFGQNSLYVYIIESILLFATPFVLKPSGFWINSLVELTIVAVAWLCVRQKLLFRIIPR